jgi:AraC-like DNA-binding protein
LAADIHDHALRVLAPKECLVCGLQFLPGSYEPFKHAYRATWGDGSARNSQWHGVAQLAHWPTLASCKGDPAESFLTYLQRQLLDLFRDSGILNGARPKRGQSAASVNSLAMELLASSDHSEPIGEAVGSAAHGSLRTTEQHFRRHTGLTIKRYQRIARFRHAMQVLFEGNDHDAPALSDLAIELGYSDQAHMAREIRAFSNWTSSEIRSGRHQGCFDIYRFMLCIN